MYAINTNKNPIEAPASPRIATSTPDITDAPMMIPMKAS